MTIDDLLERTTAIPETGCLIWLGAVRSGGYGVITIKQQHYEVHRLAWLLSGHELPKGRFVCHHCHTRLCINPDHLFLGTSKKQYDRANKSLSQAQVC